MTVYNCEWCGRFYASPAPEASACKDHIFLYNIKLRADIERFNARLKAR